MTDGLEARLDRLAGEVAQISRRLDNLENWMRVVVGLQVTGLIATLAMIGAIIQLLVG